MEPLGGLLILNYPQPTEPMEEQHWEGGSPLGSVFSQLS